MHFYITTEVEYFSIFISQSYDIFFKEWFGKMKGELLHGQTEITYMKLFQ